MKELKVSERVNPATGGATTLSVVLNPECNGGETISLEVDLINNGDNEFYHNISLNTSCYGTSNSRVAMYNVPFERLEEAVRKLSRAIEDIKINEMKRDNPRYS